MDKMRMESVDMTAQNIEKIGALFPNCITEMLDEERSTPEKKVYKKAINFELLKQMLSGDVLEGDEAYEFTWVGKKASIVEANKPIRKTLRPCPEESVNWDNTENLYIEGDNLEVLKLLQESYLGKVKMIYIDPPYNTGNDFIYNDDFKMTGKEYADETGELDEDGNRMFKNTVSNGRFHSDWCSMIYSRLMLARNLLSDDGVIFISISEDEVTNLKNVCNEVLGEDCLVTVLHVELSATQGMKVKAAQNGNIVKNAEYILVYSKDGHKNIADTILYDYRPEYDGHYTKYLTEDMEVLNLLDVYNNENPSHKVTNAVEGYASEPYFRAFIESHLDNIFRYDKTTGFNAKDFVLGKVVRVERDGRSYTLERKNNGVDQLMFLSASYGYCDNFRKSFGLRKIRGDWWKEFYLDMGNVSKEGQVVFTNGKKPVRLIEQLCKMCTKSGDTILDFFSGSATTAHAVMKLNHTDNERRNYIMVQLPEKCEVKSEFSTICEIGKERIRRAGKKIKEENPNAKDLDTGFRVLKLDDSNMTDVYYSPNDYSQAMLAMLESNIKSDRNDLDLLFGCLLEWGLPLSLPYCSEQIDGCTVHNYNDGDLIACFDENVPDSVIKEIARKQPLRAVFRDSSFANSPSKINVGEIFKLMAPDTRVKVI